MYTGCCMLRCPCLSCGSPFEELGAAERCVSAPPPPPGVPGVRQAQGGVVRHCCPRHPEGHEARVATPRAPGGAAVNSEHFAWTQMCGGGEPTQVGVFKPFPSHMSETQWGIPGDVQMNLQRHPKSIVRNTCET